MKWILAISFFFSGSFSIAQDIHFTQFYDSPLNLNPALAGQFNGAVRVNGNYRHQWQSIKKAFSTAAISADFNGPFKTGKWGAGLNVFHDIAGDSRFTTDVVALNVSRRIQLTSDSTHLLSLGLQPSFIQRGIDLSDLSWSEQFNGNVFDPNLPSSEAINLSQSSFNFAGGVSYTWQKSRTRYIQAGFGVFNIVEPITNFISSASDKINRRINFHALGSYPLKPDILLEPFFLAQFQNTYREFMVGATVRKEMDPRSFHYRAVFIGGSSRIGDAANLTAGYYYGPWKFGLSYDINYSRLIEASNYRGGFEIAVVYILKGILPPRIIYKHCPDFL